MPDEADLLRLIRTAKATIDARNREKAQLDNEIHMLKQSLVYVQRALDTSNDVMQDMKRYKVPSKWNGYHSNQFKNAMHFGGEAFASAKYLRDSIESSRQEIKNEILRRELQKNDLAKLITSAVRNISKWQSSINDLSAEGGGSR